MTIYVTLAGGLANQVFEYVAGLAIAGKGNEHAVICDTSVLEAYAQPGSGVTPRKFELEFLEAIQTNAPPPGLIDCGHNQLPQKYDPSENYRLSGYFQDLKYWHPWIRQLIRSRVPRVDPPIYPNTMAIQVRRGDYANNPGTTAFHGLMPVEYFVEAAEILKTRNPQITDAFIFSDDTEWCIEHLLGELPVPATIRTTVPEYPWQDIAAMACCGYHVISNSTFGWLGAYLADAKDVVYPSQWFRHAPAPPIFPESWIKL